MYVKEEGRGREREWPGHGNIYRGSQLFSHMGESGHLRSGEAA